MFGKARMTLAGGWRGSRRGARLALAVLLVSVVMLCAASPAMAFTDVGPGDWCWEAVDALSGVGVVGGFEDGRFGPDESVTRAQFAAMLARVLALPAAASEPFRDVDAGNWYYDYVASLYVGGIVSGTEPDRFSPELTLNRQQAATFTMRGLALMLTEGRHPVMGAGEEGASLPDLGLSEAEAYPWLAGFSDRDYIAAAHTASVANGVRFGILNGQDDGRYYPLIDITRAQAAAILYRAFYQTLSERGGYPAAVAAAPYPTLEKGSQGKLVKWLETKLASMKYNVGAIDEVFDYRTKDAVMAFQKVERLERTGVAGPQVWGRIFGARQPSMRYSRSGRWVEVDLTRQMLFLAKEGSLARIVPISSGRPGMSTPTGQTSIQRKAYGWVTGPLGSMYSPSYFRAHHAIHGSNSVPPWPASHGCIRTPVWMTDALYWDLPMGTTVFVYYN